MVPGGIHYCDQFSALPKGPGFMASEPRKEWQRHQNEIARTGLGTIGDALADALAPDNELLTAKLAEIEMTKAEYLEKMAAAFIVETGIPASECVLVQQELPKPQIGWKFYFERRKA